MSEGEGGVEVSGLDNWLGGWKVWEKFDVLGLDMLSWIRVGHRRSGFGN